MSITTTLGVKTTLIVAGLATLASGAEAISDELNILDATVNGTGLSIDINASIAAPQSNNLNVYLLGTNTSGSYGTTDDLTNLILLDSISMSETTAKKNIQIPAEHLAPYFKLVFSNDCSAALTAATVNYRSRTITNA